MQPISISEWPYNVSARIISAIIRHYIRQKMFLWFEQVSVVLPKQFISVKSTSICRNNTISVTISTSPPITTKIQWNLCHFSPFWDHLIIWQKRKLSVIFSRRNWFLCFGQKCVSVVHCWQVNNATLLCRSLSTTQNFFVRIL